MRLLFAHDNKFILQGYEAYSDPQFPASLWERYLDSFTELTVAGRRGSVAIDGPLGKLVRSSAPAVDFALFPNLSTLNAQLFRRRAVLRSMGEIVGNVDAVISRLPSEIGLLAATTARRLGKPWAVEVVGCAWDSLWNHGRWEAKFYAPLMVKRMRGVVARAPFALYVTSEFLQRRYPSNGITTCCSNVAVHVSDEIILQRRLAHIAAASTEKPLVLGLIGSLQTGYKGIQTVLKALAEYRHKLPPVVFRVLGGGNPGPWRIQAEKLGIGDVAVFEGTLPPGGPVLQWLDSVDIYLQPSKQEGLPRALIEAMSRGCPAIGSTCGGIPELLDPSCLIRPGDHRHLGVLLQNATTNADWRAEHARRNWLQSRHYDTKVLDKRRGEFWRRFSEYAVNHG